jgi:hypothetical protein
MTNSSLHTTHDSRHRHRASRRIRLSAIGLTIGLFASLFAATSASAVVATGHAVGYESTTGYWIGSYRMADGNSGFCVNLGRTAPTGNDFELVDARTLGWYSDDDRARLAYISRTWAGTSDPTVAASAQLATWMITGLDGRSPAELAARAAGNATAVLAGATAMIAQANGQDGASRSVTTRAIIDRSGDGTDNVRADLEVDFLAGKVRVARGAQHGTITLSGATFTDGSTSKQVVNGTRYAIVSTTGDALTHIHAQADFTNLPYGDAVTIGRNNGNVQNLLIATAASGSATGTVSIERPTPKPFQPRVATQTSTATAAAGASITDKLSVTAAPVDGVSAQWGVYGPDGGPYRPIPVTVRSMLLGPFTATVTEADAPPADAPVVCTVQTVVDKGPGDYETGPCTLPGPGHYVWVENIEATDTPVDSGRVHVRPWHSKFAVTTEVTVVPQPVAPETVQTAPIRYLADTGSSIDPRTTALAGGIIAFGIALAAVGWARTRRLLSSARRVEQ